MNISIGTCSICGGSVIRPFTWWGITPPPAICEGCGATKADSGPVINMKPKPKHEDEWEARWKYIKNTKTDEEKK